MKRCCPLCANTTTSLWAKTKDYEYYTTTDEFEYYYCSECNSIFIDPMPVDRLQEIYPSNYYSFIGRHHSLAISIKEWLDKRWFSSILKKITSPKISILDCGGGTGWLLSMMRTLDNRIDFTQVVDIDSQAEQEARNANHQFYNGRIEEFESSRRFDIILLLNLVEHVSDPQAVLSKIASLLAPGGVAVIKTPNIDSLDARLFRHSYWGGLHAPRHWVLFSEQSFKQMVGRTSLQLDSFTYTQGAPFWSWSVLVWLKKKGIVTIDSKRPAIYHPLNGLLEIIFAAGDFIRSPFAKTSQMIAVLRKPK